MTGTVDHNSFQERLRIRSVAERYFFLADSQDAAGVARCFASDGMFSSASQPDMRMVGRDEIEAAFRAFTKWGRSCHMIASMDLTVDGEQATGSLFGVSYVAGAARPGDPMRVRGLRYQDRWKIEHGEWVLAERVHEALWQYQTIQMHTRLPDVDERRAPLHAGS